MPRPALPAIADQIAAPPAKPRKIAPRMRQVIELLLSGACRTQKAAAERVGIDATHVSKELRKPHIQAFIARETRGSIGAAQLPAAATLVRLLDANSEHVAAQVAERLLAINGIKPDDTSRVAVSVDIRAGYVIDLRNSPSVINES